MEEAAQLPTPVSVMEEAFRYFGAEPGRLQLLKNDWHLIGDILSLTQFTYLLSLHAGRSGMARFHAKHLLSAIIQLHSDLDCSDSNADGTISWDAFNRELIRRATSVAPARPAADDDPVQPLGRLPLEMAGDDFAPGPHRTTIDRVVVLDPPLELLLCEHVPVAEPDGRAKSRYLDPPGEPTVRFHQRISLWRLAGASLQRVRVIAEKSGLLSCATMVSSTQIGLSTTVCEMALATTCLGAQVWSVSVTGRVMIAKLVKAISTPRPLLCLACERVGRATRRMLFGGAVDGSVLVWDSEKWNLRQTIAAHDGAVSGLHLLPSLDALVTVSHDRKLRVWDLLEERARLQPCGGERWHRGPVVGVAYCRVHQLVVSVSDDRTAVVMNPALRERLCSLTGHAYPIVSVAQTPDAIITADARLYVCIWELSSLTCVQKFRISSAEDSTLAAAVTLRTGPPLLLALVDGGFHLFGTEDTSRERREAPAALLYSQKHSFVVSAGGHALQVWDARTGALLKSLRSFTESPISAACLDHTEYNCLVGMQDGSVLQFNLSVGTLVRALPSHRAEITALALVCSAAVGRAKMSGLSSRKVLNEEAQHGALLVSASDDRVLHLSSVRQGCLLVAFQIGGGNLSCLATSPHAGLVATGSSSGMLSLWTVLNATAVRQDSRCDGHGSEVTALAFLGDCGLLASADANAELVLWRAAAQRCTPLRRLRHRAVGGLGMPLVVTALTFEAGRELLCTADETGVVNVWSLRELGLGVSGEGDGGAAEPAAAGMAGPLLAGLEVSEVEPVAVWAAHKDVALCLVAIGGDAMEPGSRGSFALLSAGRDRDICAWLVGDGHDAALVECRLCGRLSTGWALPLDLTRMLAAEEELRATLVSELRAFEPPDGLSVFEQGHLLHQYIQPADERARRKAGDREAALLARGSGNEMHASGRAAAASPLEP